MNLCAGLRPLRALSSDIHCACRFAVEQGIGEGDDLRARGREHGSERVEKSVIRRIIGPQRKDAAVMQMRRERAEAGGLVEGGVLRGEEVARGVVDVEEDGEIHLLATRYGWSEEDILRISPWRRAIYLSLAGTR